MNYQFFRLSLSENAAPPLLEAAGIPAREPRGEFLRRIFIVEQVFVHRRQEFKYRYFGTFDTIVYGAIGREREEGTHNENFQPGTSINWEIANVFLDTSGEKDGQKLVVQHNARVGLPTGILNSFVDYINQKYSLDAWWTSIFNISDQSDLWEIEKKYRGSITRISLRFAVPNMLKSSDSISDELKEIGLEVHGQEVEMDIVRQRGGLSLQNKYIKNAINYISQGAGQVIIKVRKKIIYNSKNKNLTKSVENDVDIPSSSPDQIEKMAVSLLDKNEDS